MSDVVLVAIITAIPGILAAIMSLRNGWNISNVATKVDGINSVLSKDLKESQEARVAQAQAAPSTAAPQQVTLTTPATISPPNE